MSSAPAARATRPTIQTTQADVPAKNRAGNPERGVGRLFDEGRDDGENFECEMISASEQDFPAGPELSRQERAGGMAGGFEPVFVRPELLAAAAGEDDPQGQRCAQQTKLCPSNDSLGALGDASVRCHPGLRGGRAADCAGWKR
jgi:hypothetical protein